MAPLVSRAAYRRGKITLFFLVTPNHKDGVYLNYISQLIAGTLFHFSEMDINIKERACELELNNIMHGDEFSITDTKGTRVYELKKNNQWVNIFETDGIVHDAELEELLK